MPLVGAGSPPAIRQLFCDNRKWKLPLFCFCITFGGYFIPKAIAQLEGTSQSRPCTRHNCRDGLCLWSYCLHLQAPFAIVSVIAVFLGLGACWHRWRDFISCPCPSGKAPNEPPNGIVPCNNTNTGCGAMNGEDCVHGRRNNNNISIPPIIIIVPLLEDGNEASPPPQYDPPPSYNDCVPSSKTKVSK